MASRGIRRRRGPSSSGPLISSGQERHLQRVAYDHRSGSSGESRYQDQEPPKLLGDLRLGDNYDPPPELGHRELWDPSAPKSQTPDRPVTSLDPVATPIDAAAAGGEERGELDGGSVEEQDPSAELPSREGKVNSTGPEKGSRKKKKKREKGVKGASREEKVKKVVVGTFANVFSLVPLLSPFYTYSQFRDLHIVRQIFPPKGVVCNFIAAVIWTIYMIMDMFIADNYEGIEGLVLNGLSMAFNMAILVFYYSNSRERKKFWISLLLLILMVIGGTAWLTYNTDIIKSQATTVTFMNIAQVCGVLGTTLTVLINVFPFVDLWKMIKDGENNFTLLVPIIINTFISSAASVMWAWYAWGFSPEHPNYFLYANGVAAAMNFLQGVFEIYVRSVGEVQGQIPAVESLRGVFISVSNALERLVENARDESFWRREYLIELKDSIKHGRQSLSVLVTLVELEKELLSDLEIDAAYKHMVLENCDLFLNECSSNIEELRALWRAIDNKLLNAAGQYQDLQRVINNLSAHMRTLADSLRQFMQIVNAIEGMPSTVPDSFAFCTHQILYVKAAADLSEWWKKPSCAPGQNGAPVGQNGVPHAPELQDENGGAHV